MARVICFRLLVHCERRAASRADWTAGSSKAIKTAMMAMTTSSSIRVKPGFLFIDATSRTGQGRHGRGPPIDAGPPSQGAGPLGRSGRGAIELGSYFDRL